MVLNNRRFQRQYGFGKGVEIFFEKAVIGNGFLGGFAGKK